MFTALDWPVFLLMLAAVELTPGPNMGWLAALSAREGRRAGLTAVLGITLGLSIQVLAAATGLGALIATAPAAYEVLRWSGVVFMLYLAAEIFFDGHGADEAGPPAARGFLRGTLVNVLNPKAFVFYLAVVAQFADPSTGPLWPQIVLLGAIHVALATLIHAVIAIAADGAAARLESWRTSFAARLVLSLMLAGIAVWIAVSTARPG